MQDFGCYAEALHPRPSCGRTETADQKLPRKLQRRRRTSDAAVVLLDGATSVPSFRKMCHNLWVGLTPETREWSEELPEVEQQRRRASESLRNKAWRTN
ncbi:hypothetical protein BDBG_05116 [Blastomyces gilchristii SLH14081]|uniref:Uncharacterized protein n=1 Tax=Blastomyces gilchristii (strain SLH14081) TaxID=559298 RepID=A0A179USA8_BLAGS|nr:uncharacterized protein BDBG_05116 [Blastomyces gilchristii SLH14081]OAT09312.1 hypothetical protein BDBG_05116 [Blastomyces gilchristii SLH14081]